MKPRVIHETPDWMILEKPAPAHTLKGKDTETLSMQGWLEDHYPDLQELPECGLVHRLDMMTTGCLFVAKNQTALEHFKRKFRLGEGIQKIYLAFVEGVLEDGEFSLYFTSRYKSSQTVTVQSRGKMRDRGRCAWTQKKVIEDSSVLEVKLLGSGKRHQIRAGLAYLKHPILGDPLYSERGPWPGGLGLHAWKIIVGSTEVECPLPAVWNLTFPS